MGASHDTTKQTIIMREMLRYIGEQRLSRGALLPTEAQWAERYLVSRVTVRGALRRLCEQGWLRREQGRGTFLTRSPVNGIDGGAAFSGTEESSAPPPARELGLLLRWAHRDGQPLYYEELIAGVKDAADAIGARFATWFIETGETAAAAARRILDGRKGAGPPAIVLSAADVSESLDDWPPEVPLCCLGQPNCRRSVPYVDIDNTHGAWLATRHMLALGRTRIAFFGDFTRQYAQNRILGYVRALQEASARFDPELVVDGVDAGCEQAGSDALRRLWERGARPDGIFAGSGAAVGIWRLCRESGLRVPEDLSLVGLDDFSWIMARMPLELTMVAQPFRTAAATAAFRALAAGDGGAPGGMELLRPRLVARDTCGAAARVPHGPTA